MAAGKKYRIAAVALATAVAVVAVGLWATVRAARQVRPFYQQALTVEPHILERGRQELESRATALYSDVQNRGTWQAVFTAEQINGWLATQLADSLNSADANFEKTNTPAADVREPRIAIAPGVITLGFKTHQGGVDTVVSVDASVFLTDEGDVAVRLVKVQAGALPLPVGIVADKLSAACARLSLPVLWSENEGQPVAMIRIGNAADSPATRWFIDALELTEGELFVAGHTESRLELARREEGRGKVKSPGEN
jgi:hypothetical protein